VHSRTQFAHHGFLEFDPAGQEIFVVVVKATYGIDVNGNLDADIEQLPVCHVDSFWGAPGLSSIRYEADLAWHKPAVEIVINGHAYTRNGSATGVTVEMITRHFQRRAHISGDRVWESGLLGVRATPPVPFESMPLVYERAFGGFDLRESQEKQVGSLENPVGIGFFSVREPDDGAPLPNIEDPTQLIGQWRHHPRPIGFGFIGRGWQPRVKYAGTYDATWKSDKFPLLPDDFSERHFLAAPPEQVVPRFDGSETITLRNMTPDGLDMNLSIPSLRIPVHARWEREARMVTADLDTVIIEPTVSRLVLICRACLDVRRKPNVLKEVFVGPLSRGEERAVLGRKRYIGRQRP
jgi:hypothetical protein